MKKLLCSLFIFLFIFISVSPVIAKADGNLDEIENYKIIVDMESDGSMDIKYHIDWKVLDDSSKGPLEWVKVGIPNSYADNIIALSSNINDISYYNEGGDYVRIVLDKSYHAGEIVPLDFSLHQTHMYKLDRDNNLCSYSFTPGWFEGADVKSMTILWNDENVLSSDSTDTDGKYLKWTASLSAGGKLCAAVNYRSGVFSTSDDMSSDALQSTGSNSNDYGQNDEYTDNFSYDSFNGAIAGIFIFGFIIIVILSIVVRISGGGGRYRGGFGGYIGGGYHGGGGFGGGGHCACASSCACACACACAGGGRAGCSAKSFYGVSIQTDKLKCVLKQDSKHIGKNN
jgi:hypothetical protein